MIKENLAKAALVIALLIGVAMVARHHLPGDEAQYKEMRSAMDRADSSY